MGGASTPWNISHMCTLSEIDDNTIDYNYYVGLQTGSHAQKYAHCACVGLHQSRIACTRMASASFSKQKEDCELSDFSGKIIIIL